MIDLGHLREYSLFAGLADDTLDFLRTRLRRDHWQSGMSILEQGQHGDSVYFIQEGRVAVRVDGVCVAELSEGEQFGEMHLIDVQPRSASVVAVDAVTTLSMCNRDFLDLRKRNMEAFIVILMNCARDISRRLREVNDQHARVMQQAQALLKQAENGSR